MALRFDNAGVKQRYGDKLYLSGSIFGISSSDTISVFYGRLGSDEVKPVEREEATCLWFSGTSGWYSFDSTMWYFRFSGAGLYRLYIYDSRMCSEPAGTPRAEWLMNIVLPRFQYQLIFDLEDPDLGDNAWRLQAEYDKYAAADQWLITHVDPDCFNQLEPVIGGKSGDRETGWLSLGVEFGESPCAPLPHYLCPLPTPQTQYWRGECSCDLFKNTLQPLGIPCSHLIAAMNWYSGEPAWSKYIQCP